MVRDVLKMGDPVLLQQASPVTTFGTPELDALLADMRDTMAALDGAGLAAPQIGVSQRLFVVDVASSDEPSDLRVFINPEVVAREGETVWEEGCLSFPGIHEEIERAAKITMRAVDAEGRPFELTAEGLLAIAMQHEHDHLDGTLMVDHVSLLRKRMIDREMRKNR
jgi:peptide deformylase